MAEIMGSAPQLADRLNRNPHLLEAVLSGDFFEPIPPRELLEEELASVLTDAQDLQDVLELTRRWANRSEEHTSELQSLMRSSYAVFCMKKKTRRNITHTKNN